VDTRWYLDVNRFARASAWAHGFMAAYAEWAGVVLLGALVVLAWWVARRHGPRAVAGALWAGGGAAVAVALNQPLIHLVGRLRPYDVLHHVEVLVPRGHDFTFPSDHATAAGAVVCGLFVARRRILAGLAALAGALLAFARVYVGAHYPGDVLAGLAFGAVVAGVLAPVVLWLVTPVVTLLARTPLRLLVSSQSSPPVAAAGPHEPAERLLT